MDGTPQILENFKTDPRVKIVRSHSVLSVSENWKNALENSSGDYIVMLGDDDSLLPGYFERMRAILEKYDNPDCVLHNAYSFVTPESVEGNSISYYCPSHFNFDSDLQTEQIIPMKVRRSIVHDMFRFKVRIPLNMQTTMFSRKAGQALKNGTFQAPFPDHFLLNSLLLIAKSWVFVPEKLVVVGISQKSFGHYVYNNRQEAGLAYLGINTQFPGRLPGNELMNGMHIWLNMLLESYPNELRGIRVDRGGYVRRQVYAWYLQRRHAAISSSEMMDHFGKLTPHDWMGLACTAVDPASWKRLFRVIRSRVRGRNERLWDELQPIQNVGNIREFTKWLTEKKFSKA